VTVESCLVRCKAVLSRECCVSLHVIHKPNLINLAKKQLSIGGSSFPKTNSRFDSALFRFALEMTQTKLLHV
jgi:hypothetical protein